MNFPVHIICKFDFTKSLPIKNIYNINYIENSKNPVKNRMSKEFMEYYEKIWNDLNNEK